MQQLLIVTLKLSSNTYFSKTRTKNTQEFFILILCLRFLAQKNKNFFTQKKKETIFTQKIRHFLPRKVYPEKKTLFTQKKRVSVPRKKDTFYPEAETQKKE